MKTRLDKYLDETEEMVPKRVAKNTDLYNEIKKSDLEYFNIGSNAKVIGDNESQINIDKIKEILEKNYQETPKKRSMKFETIQEEEPEMEKTREYDINAILEQAREEKEVDYQEERLKKIRDTQYDILKNLELEAKKETETQEKSKEELLELINTINLNEIHNKNGKTLQEETKDLDPLDILSDLKGDDNTVVAGAKEFTKELEALEVKEEDLAKEEEKEIENALNDTIDDSFYTNSMTFDKKDFASLDDDEGKMSILVKILIVVVFVSIVVGVVFFLNEFLNLGWF